MYVCVCTSMYSKYAHVMHWSNCSGDGVLLFLRLELCRGWNVSPSREVRVLFGRWILRSLLVAGPWQVGSSGSSGFLFYQHIGTISIQNYAWTSGDGDWRAATQVNVLFVDSTSLALWLIGPRRSSTVDCGYWSRLVGTPLMLTRRAVAGADSRARSRTRTGEARAQRPRARARPPRATWDRTATERRSDDCGTTLRETEMWEAE